MYSIALEALDLSDHSDEARRCDILIALAEAQQHADDVPGAQESLYHAAGIAQRLGDWSRLADIVLTAPLRWPFPGRPNGLVTMLAERVLCFLPERDVARRALVTARWAADLSHLREERKHSEQSVGTCARNVPGPRQRRSLEAQASAVARLGPAPSGTDLRASRQQHGSNSNCAPTW